MEDVDGRVIPWLSIHVIAFLSSEPYYVFVYLKIA